MPLSPSAHNSKRKITNQMIRKELRARGRFFRLAIPRLSRRMAKFGNWLMRLVAHPQNTSFADMVIHVENIARADGSGSFRLCVYAPMAYKADPNHELLAAVLWIHGGGYGIGIPEIDEGFIRPFIETRRCVVVSPDYRLSVEAPFPAALEDCHTALAWLVRNARTLGIRSDQVFVGGESAGGGLAAALCAYERDGGGISVAFQMPLYPMLDDRPYPSSTDNDAPVWDSKMNERAWKAYVREGYRSADLSPYAAPGRLEDFSALPPAFTFVGDIEPFHDETLSYFSRLKEAGVPVELHVFEGCFHAFDMLVPRAKVSREARRLLYDAFSRAVDERFAPQPDREVES